MNRWTLIRRSSWYYRRTHLGVIAGAAVAATVLIGAMIVGDCLRHTLHWMAVARLGNVQLAMTAQHPTLDDALCDELAVTLNEPVAGVLQFRGVVNPQGGGRRAYNVQINGVDERFMQLGATENPFVGLSPDQVVINTHLADKLKLGTGDVLIVRLPKPSALSMDMPIGSAADDSIVFNGTVGRIIDDHQFGRFSLFASQVAPLNLFMANQDLVKLAEVTGKGPVQNRYNLLLVGGADAKRIEAASAQEAMTWPTVKSRHLGYTAHRIASPRQTYWTTDRVFFDPPVVRTMQEHGPRHDVVFSYLANELRIGDRAAPYSMVCAYGDSQQPDYCKPADRKLGPDDIVLNQWLADDLNAKVGDTLTMKYYKVEQGRKLDEAGATFEVVGIVPMDGAGGDRTLMPDYPGITESEDINDWEPGFNIDLSKIRDKDEAYWDKYRGAPKAFINLKTGQKLWGNRWGDVTQLRFAGGDADDSGLEKMLAQHISPADLGMVFRPVRDEALKAASQGQDFTGLFVGLSIFIIVAAAMLTGLMFVFGIEQRAGQVGTMLSLGFRPRSVAVLLMGEGLLLSLAGAVIGAVAAIVYAWLVLQLLAGVWSGAVGSAALLLVIKPATLCIGAAVSVMISLIAMALTLRRQLKRTPRELLSGPVGITPITPRGRRGFLIAIICLVSAAVLVLSGLMFGGAMAVMVYFLTGLLVLVGGLFGVSAKLGRLAASTSGAAMDLRQLGRRNSIRRRGRSMAVVILLATGLFMLIAVCANVKTPPRQSDDRTSPTGGFELYAESALPIYHDLNSEDGRKQFALTDPRMVAQMKDVHVIPLRVRAGDDASCLNLNRPQRPRLVGVPIDQFKQVEPFTIKQLLAENTSSGDGWQRLSNDQPDVPGFVDAGTAQWILKVKPGDTIAYTDELGQPFNVKIVGLLNDTIMQGSIVIAEDQFIKHYPDAAGYNAFLIDTPPDRIEPVKSTLADRLSDVGFDVTTTTDRLAAFNAVQNTYLSIFAALGGLGMIMGSIGLGVVTARNILERRGELALMRAVGFERAAVATLLVAEHRWLLYLGLAVGVTASLVAAAPTWLTSDTRPPYLTLTILVVLIWISGEIWIRLAARSATRGPMLQPLREE